MLRAHRFVFPPHRGRVLPFAMAVPWQFLPVLIQFLFVLCQKLNGRSEFICDGLAFQKMGTVFVYEAGALLSKGVLASVERLDGPVVVES
jgi:hypothetical protein